jgi:ribokinase
MAVILSLGSINADFQVRVEEAPEGPSTVLANELLRTSGGKAANVAVLARRLGAEARLLGCVGDDDLAEQALAGPRREGVDLGLVRRGPGPTGLSQIAVTPDGEKLIILALNANDAWADDADRVAQAVAEAPAGSVLVADLEIPPVLVTAAVRAARQAGLLIVLDPAPADRVPEDLLPLVDHITPDHREAQTLTGIDASEPDGARRAAEQLRERGVGAAHVKMASGGCAVAFQDGTAMVAGPADPTVVDATGGGDAYAGALAWALWSGRSPREAAPLAVAASACAIGAYGSQESYPSPVELAAMHVRVVQANQPREAATGRGRAGAGQPE